MIEKIKNILTTYKNNNITYIYYKSKNFNKDYNNILKDLSVFPIKLHANSLTKNITQNILLSDESYILDLLDILYYMSIGKLKVDNIEKILSYKINIKYYDFFDKNVVDFYYDIIDDPIIKKSMLYIKKYLDINTETIINIRETCSTLLKYHILLFNINKDINIDKNYINSKYNNSIIYLSLKSQYTKNNTIKTNDIYKLFNEKDNIFNYINTVGNIKIGIYDNVKYYNIEYGINSIKLKDNYRSSTLNILECNSNIMKLFYRLVDEIKSRHGTNKFITTYIFEFKTDSTTTNILKIIN